MKYLSVIFFFSGLIFGDTTRNSFNSVVEELQRRQSKRFSSPLADDGCDEEVKKVDTSTCSTRIAKVVDTTTTFAGGKHLEMNFSDGKIRITSPLAPKAKPLVLNFNSKTCSIPVKSNPLFRCISVITKFLAPLGVIYDPISTRFINTSSNNYFDYNEKGQFLIVGKDFNLAIAQKPGEMPSEFTLKYPGQKRGFRLRFKWKGAVCIPSYSHTNN